MSKPKYWVRVREQTIQGKAIATVWLLEGRAGSECRMYGDMQPERAAEVAAMFEAAGIPVERDKPTPGTDELVQLPCDTVEKQIADTATNHNQRGLFE